MSALSAPTATRSIGEIVGGREAAKVRRTHQPVRRNSYHRGEREARWWRGVDPAEPDAIVEAAKLHERATKQAGCRNGKLGYVAIRVIECLARMVDWTTGALEPAIDTIARETGNARSAVVLALRRLKEEGFLEWMRRTEPVDGDGPGPRVRQITNAYRLAVPACWAKRVAMRVAQKLALRRKRAGEQQRAPRPPRTPAEPSPALAEALAGLEAAMEQHASPSDGQNPHPHL